MNYVYVFDFGDMVKIGQSKRPLDRLKEIERGNGVKATRTFAISAEDKAIEIETSVHLILANHRVQGREYFSCSFQNARDTVVSVACKLLGKNVSGVKVGGVTRNSQKEATARYNKKAYDRIDIIVPKGKRQVIKDYAKSKGMSANRFINEAIDKAMKAD